MPFVFVIGGLVLLTVAIQGTQGAAVQLIKSEFVGSNSFLVWVAAIAILGALGYVRPIRPVANALLLLILLVIVLKNGGNVFAQFNAAIRNPVQPQGAGGGSGPYTASNPFTGSFFPGETMSTPSIGLTPLSPSLIPGTVPGA
jgi:hypothetical protein